MTTDLEAAAEGLGNITAMRYATLAEVIMKRTSIYFFLALLAYSGPGAEIDRRELAVESVDAQVPPESATDSSAEFVCDSVEVRWKSIPGMKVERGDTVFVPGDRLPDYSSDGFTIYPHEVSSRGCFVVGEHPSGFLRGVEDEGFWATAGWPFLWRITADGPAGAVLTYQRDWVRCEVRKEWDGGDVTNPDYVPEPFYREITLCWTHTRQIAPGDTAQPR